MAYYFGYHVTEIYSLFPGDYFLKYARDSISAFLAAAAPKRLVSFILVDESEEISIYSLHMAV